MKFEIFKQPRLEHEVKWKQKSVIDDYWKIIGVGGGGVGGWGGVRGGVGVAQTAE